MPTPLATARRLMARAKHLARRVVPVPYQRLDPIRDRLAAIEAVQDEHLHHIRNLVERLSALSARVDAMESSLNGRLDDLAERSETTVALGWDHVALTRRLAAIEDRLGALGLVEAEEDAPRALAG